MYVCWLHGLQNEHKHTHTLDCMSLSVHTKLQVITQSQKYTRNNGNFPPWFIHSLWFRHTLKNHLNSNNLSRISLIVQTEVCIGTCLCALRVKLLLFHNR